MAVESETDEVDAAQWQLLVEAMLLWQISDVRVATPRRSTEHMYLAGGGLLQAEQHAQQGRLARTICTEDDEELASFHH
jgi:hypothetical protein